MFKNALLYRIHKPAAWVAPTLPDIDQRLAALPFIECGATQQESSGWLEPRGQKHGAFIESIGGQWVLRLGRETRAVPSGVVKTRLQAKLDQIEKDTGRRPKGKLGKELKDEVVFELLPRAFPKRADTTVWIDPQAGLVLVGAASSKKADGVVTQLIEMLGGGLKLTLLQTALAPASAMAGWLADKEAPAGFAIDRDCELKQPDSEKAAVRYARHTLDIDEVGEHIRQGKLPTQLALTWAGRVSFVLTEGLALKKIKLLDSALEGRGSTQGRADDGFDADVALFTGELRLLLPELIAALGGEQLPGAVAATPAAPATSAALTGADDVAPWEDAVPA